MTEFAPKDLLRYGFEYLQPGHYPSCEDLIFDEVEGRHGGFFAGVRTDAYIASLRHSGGCVLNRDGEPKIFMPKEVRRGNTLLLPFPIIAAADEGRGGQCVSHIIQLILGLYGAQEKQSRLREIYIDFPDDLLPSAKLIHMLGLCDAMPDRRPFSEGPSDRIAHRFVLADTMIPFIFGNLLSRTPAWVGSAYITTSGSAGEARISFEPELSPFAMFRLAFFRAMIAGDLDIVGMRKVPGCPASIAL